MGNINQAILNRAYEFVKHWQDVRTKNHNMITERQNDREFIADFYEVFGISRATYRPGFEYKQPGSKRIDSLLPGMLLIEMESQGTGLLNKSNSGLEQARHYAYNLPQKDRPQYIIASDFNLIYLENPMNGDKWETTLDDFVKNIDIFSFLLGYEQHVQTQQAQVNKEAAESISKVYRSILEIGVAPNAASLLMTRLVFALFADDTEIFPRNGMFQDFISNTREDGSDLLPQIILLFNILNTPDDQRLGVAYKEWPYINGGLFAVDIASVTINRGLQFDEDVRTAILEASKMDWSQISPVIFGSMFEGALDPEKRHDLGAHFTSETNILKVIDSLFMNDLRIELQQIQQKKRGRKSALEAFHNKLSTLKFLDPASGSGNFLIVAYRELRRLEHEVLGLIMREDPNYIEGQVDAFFVEENIKVEVAQFYGIEIQAYAVSVARVGLWLMDHLMNVEASQLFGMYFARLPLHAGANVVQADALQVDWLKIFDEPQGDVTFTKIQAHQLSYILGNPPFIGARLMDKVQKAGLLSVFNGVKKAGNLDFVSAWYYKAAQLMQLNPEMKAALVSTNSVVQGEQATILWRPLIERLGIHINFAHQTFKWDNNGAAVFVIIIGFSTVQKTKKIIFTYPDIKGLSVVNSVSKINQYLLPADTVFIDSLKEQISGLPKMGYGTSPIDDGQFIFTEEEKTEFLFKFPQLTEFFYEFMGAKEHLNSSAGRRYALYLKELPISTIRNNRELLKIAEHVREFRANSSRPGTKKMADFPTVFGDDRFKKKPALLVPRVTSEIGNTYH